MKRISNVHYFPSFNRPLYSDFSFKDICLAVKKHHHVKLKRLLKGEETFLDACLRYVKSLKIKPTLITESLDQENKIIFFVFFYFLDHYNEHISAYVDMKKQWQYISFSLLSNEDLDVFILQLLERYKDGELISNIYKLRELLIEYGIYNIIFENRINHILAQHDVDIARCIPFNIKQVEVFFQQGFNLLSQIYFQFSDNEERLETVKKLMEYSLHLISILPRCEQHRLTSCFFKQLFFRFGKLIFSHDLIKTIYNLQNDNYQFNMLNKNKNHFAHLTPNIVYYQTLYETLYHKSSITLEHKNNEDLYDTLLMLSSLNLPTIHRMYDMHDCYQNKIRLKSFFFYCSRLFYDLTRYIDLEKMKLERKVL